MPVRDWKAALGPGDRLRVDGDDPGDPPEVMTVADCWERIIDLPEIDYLPCTRESDGKELLVPERSMIELVMKVDWDDIRRDWRHELEPGDRVWWRAEHGGVVGTTVDEWMRIDVAGYPISLRVTLDGGKREGSFAPSSVVSLIAKTDRGAVDG
jgi:hypothetical protein